MFSRYSPFNRLWDCNRLDQRPFPITHFLITLHLIWAVLILCAGGVLLGLCKIHVSTDQLCNPSNSTDVQVYFVAVLQYLIKYIHII